MGIYCKLLGLAGAAVLATTGVVSAATLSTSGAGVGPNFVPANFDAGPLTGVSVNDPMVAYKAAVDGGNVGGGLWLDAIGKAKVTITFLGASASAKNYAIETVGAGSLSNKSSAGTSFWFIQTAGFVNFAFKSDVFTPSGQIANGGTSDYASMRFALTGVTSNYAVALFDDANGQSTGGDKDLDDMVVGISVQAVPLPAGGLLLLTGLGGLIAARRRKA